MNWTKYPSQLAPLACAFVLTLTGVASLPVLVRAQYTPPPGTGTPDRRAGAGTRGSCLRTLKPALSLEAPGGTADEPALTVEARPTIAWNMPNSKTSTVEVALTEVALSDDSETDLLVEELSVEDRPGPASFTLRKSDPALELDRLYQVTVTVRCNEADRSGDISAIGWIKRVRSLDEKHQEGDLRSRQ